MEDRPGGPERIENALLGSNEMTHLSERAEKMMKDLAFRPNSQAIS
jgi:hypothetical protein